MYIFLLYLLTLSTPAQAYIDASLGSMLIQGLVAALMFIPFYFRKIINFFKKQNKNEEDDNNE